MNSSIRLILHLLVGLLSLAPLTVFGEYLPTGPYSFQESDLTSTIIVVPPSEEVPGVFVLRHPATPVLLFDPEKVPTGPESSSVFFEYDPKRARFSKLHVGEEELLIRGNLALELGTDKKVRVALSNEPEKGYLTVFSAPSAEEAHALLGIVALEPRVGVRGKDAGKLQAFTLSPSQSGVVKDYQVSSDHRLLLDGQEVSIRYVGLAPGRGASCEPNRALFLSEEEWQERGAADVKDADLLALAEKKGEGPIPAALSLPLRPEGNAFRALDRENGRVFRFEVFLQRRVAGVLRTVCRSTPETLQGVEMLQ
ncbi:hypothetical protein MRY87_12715 [bacterium]|nr:hypothetical protein [bacterium]